MDINKYLNIVNRVWEGEEYKITIKHPWKVPTMLLRKEKKLLCYLTEKIYSEAGEIIDLGCFLGGSTSFLAQGLKNANKTAKIQSYDLFTLGEFEKNIFFPRYNLEIPPNNDFKDLFLEYTKPYKNIVEQHVGNILNHSYDLGQIEFLFVDMMKTDRIYDHITKEFFPKLIPNKGIVIFQDYYFKNTGVWHQVLPYILKEHLVYLTDTINNSSVFLCIKEITAHDVEKCLWENISLNDKIDSIFYALKFCRTDSQKEILKEILKSIFNTKLTEKRNLYNSAQNS